MGFPLSTHEQAYKSLWVDERESFKYFLSLTGLDQGVCSVCSWGYAEPLDLYWVVFETEYFTAAQAEPCPQETGFCRCCIV